AGTTPIVTVQILAFNDFHGHLKPPSPANASVIVPPSDPAATTGSPIPGSVNYRISAGGAVYFAAHINRLRATNPNTIVVSAGDMTGASPLLSAMYNDEPTINVMNAIGVSYHAVGNHEFDHGVPELRRLQNGGCDPTSHTDSGGSCFIDPGFAGAQFEFLAANVEQSGGQTLFPAYAIKTIAGASIAFVGMTLRGTPAGTTPGATAGLVFKDEVATVNALVPSLKNQHVDSIVVVLHQGGAQAGTYNDCDAFTGSSIAAIVDGLDPAVDVVVSAHTHQSYNCVRGNRLLTSAASFGRVLTQIELTIDRNLHKVISKQANNIAITRTISPDPAVRTLVDRYAALSAPIAQRDVGTITADIANFPGANGEIPLSDVIADSMLAGTGADVAFAGGNSSLRDAMLYKQYASEGDGVVTFEKAFSIMPFQNKILRVRCTGQQIVDAIQKTSFVPSPSSIQIAGLTYSWATSRADGTGRNAADPQTFVIHGAPLQPDATYNVAVSDFMIGFESIRDCQSPVVIDVDMNMFVAYLEAHRPLAPPPRNRILKID
ncbi:MAG: bifunctional metallophosphatase/5'-nucleotidase, partial [Kofleriaceae bacterium]